MEYNFTLERILGMVFIERLTILFHILGLGDDKMVVKPKKHWTGKHAAVFLGSLGLMLVGQDIFDSLVTLTLTPHSHF